MCGIAGFIGKGDQKDLDNMVRTILHRGPDDQGTLLIDNVGLAHTRLSIIDLSPAGHQPMTDKNKSVFIVFNGEIYNFQELKNELEKTGKYVFVGHSDTEVILYAWLEYGEGVFDKLDGMFALAIYDSVNKTTVLARDRMGKKPLFWTLQNGTLIFGSELKALMAHRTFDKELDLNSIDNYLFFEYVPSPNSIFKNVNKLEPATYLIYKNGEIKKKRYWDMSFRQLPTNEQEAGQKLNELLAQSVKKRLVADVPLGILLSGGIDSTTIAYYAQSQSQNKIKTFSIGFEEKSFDESDYAKLAADFLKTDHHHAVFTHQEAVDLIPSLAEMADEPIADPSILPTHLLSKFARKEVTVALSGDGNDELMAGYITFKAQAFSKLFQMTPSVLRSGLLEILKLIPASEKNFSFEYSLKKFLKDFEGNPETRHQRWLASFSDQERASLYLPEIKEKIRSGNPELILGEHLNFLGDEALENKILYLYLKTYLPDNILVKADRASMMVALEVRSPFLDRNLVEFINSLPYNYKHRNMEGKYLLKKIMENKIPNEIIHRKKKGFGIPLAKWLKNELKPFCEDLLSPEFLKNQNIFNPKVIETVKSEHYSGRKDRRKELWTLLIFQLWYKRWFK